MKIICLFIIAFSINTKLLHVSVLFRHGARTSGNYFDKYEKYFLGIAEQELTPNGFTQELLLGRYLRHRYIKNNHSNYKDFLPNRFDEEKIEFKVSERQRTIFSSIGLLTGLYPHATFLLEKGSNLSNHNLPPINFNFNVSLLRNKTFQIIPKENDTFFHASDCFEKDKILYKYNETEKLIIDKLETIFPEIIADIRNSSYSVKKVKGFIDVVNALDNLIANFSMDIYDEATKELFRKTTLYAWYNTDLSDDKSVLLSSLILQDIKKNLESCLENEKRGIKFLSEELTRCTKINFYALHDTNIVEVLRNILEENYLKDLREKGIKNEKIFKLLVPPYATSLIFELHSEGDEYYVRLILNGEESFSEFRSGLYEKKKGIEYSIFKGLLESRINLDIEKIECLSKINRDVMNYW
jgi:hypothetical protein